MARFFSFFLLLILTTITTPGIAAAEMQPVRKLRAGLPPFEVMAAILATNQRAVTGLAPDLDPTDLATPYLTWLADADARVREQDILSGTGRSIYTVRNLGNQLTLSQGAIDFGVRYLHTPILLITGNTDSLAIRLFTQGYDDLAPAVRADLDHLHLPLAAAPPSPPPQTADTPQPDPAELRLRQVEANVDYQVRQAVARYQDRVKGGRLVVVGAVVDIANAYGRGAGCLIIINVDNETDAGKLRRLRVMARLSEELIQSHIGRQRPQKTDTLKR